MFMSRSGKSKFKFKFNLNFKFKFNSKSVLKLKFKVKHEMKNQGIAGTIDRLRTPSPPHSGGISLQKKYRLKLAGLSSKRREKKSTSLGVSRTNPGFVSYIPAVNQRIVVSFVKI